MTPLSGLNFVLALLFFFLISPGSSVSETQTPPLPYQKVCVYTIAKNEEKHVQRFAESASLADYVLVVDTGSEDNTIQALKAANINVIEKTFNPWRFDHARNFALQSLPEDCEICVWQDLDEVFTPEDWPDRLRKYFERPLVNNVLVHFVYPNAFDYFRFKAHRRQGFHYKYAVHEVFVADEGVPTHSAYADDIFVIHLQDTKKARNYIPLLELSLSEYPDEVPSHTFWLARDYFNFKQFLKAIPTFKKYLSLKTSKWAPERAAACTFIAESIWRLDSSDQRSYVLQELTQDNPETTRLAEDVTDDEIADTIERWFIRATEEAPKYRDPFLSLANWYTTQGEYEQAWNTLIASLYINHKDPIYLVSERAWSFGPYQDLANILVQNKSLEAVWNSDLNDETTYQILYQLGLVYLELNRWSEAQEVFLMAWEKAPYHLEPLYRLSERYYAAQSYYVAYMYGYQGIRLKEPSPLSFWTDQEVYDYKFADVFSVIAGFVGDHPNGRELAQRALEKAPESEQQRIRANLELFERLLKEEAEKEFDE